MKRKIGNFLVAGLSVFLGVAVCEVGARIIGLGRPILYTPDDLVGYRPKPSQTEIRRKGATVTINEEGFRVDSAGYAKTSNRPIVFVGDSVTYGGSYIDDSETFSALFCKRSNYSVCLNSGVNSWGVYNMGRFISNFEVYSSEKPSKIVLVILPGDLSRNFRSFSDTPFWDAPPAFPSGINEVISYITWRYFLPSLRSAPPKKNAHQVEVSRAKSALQNELAWKDLRGYIENSSYPIDVVITPPLKWFKRSPSHKHSSESKWFAEKLEQLKAVENVNRVCNLYEQISASVPDHGLVQSFYVDSVHLSVDGHKEWAKQLSKCIS